MSSFPPHLSGRSLGKSDQVPAAPVSTLASEPRDLEVKGKNWGNATALHLWNHEEMSSKGTLFCVSRTQTQH